VVRTRKRQTVSGMAIATITRHQSSAQGTAWTSAQAASAGSAVGLPWLNRAVAYIEEQVAAGDFPHLRAMMPEAGMSAFWEQLEEADFEEGRFERGLERLLDGIALSVERKQG
jgi:predicted acyl esterase